MSQDVATILEKIGNDSDFRKRMLKDPEATLAKEYPKLTDPEKNAIKKMISAFSADQKQTEKSWKPSSFKEFGGGILSLALIALMFWIVGITVSVMNVLPQGVTIGDSVQVTDIYARAKDLLSILFPLFGAVVTFWLGVAVESKRADQNKEAAETANNELSSVQAKDKSTRVAVAEYIGEAKGTAKSQRETTKIKATAAGIPAPEQEISRLDAIVSSLEEAEKAIRG